MLLDLLPASCESPTHLVQIVFINTGLESLQLSVYMATIKIFIVEDDPFYGEILNYHLSLNPDYEVTLFASGKELLANLYRQPDLVTIDFVLPDYKGDKLYERIREFNSDIPVIVISGQDEIAVAVNLLKMGVSDYLIKDEHTKDVLWNSIVNICEKRRLVREVESLKQELGKKFSFEHSMIGQSPALKQVMHLMEKAIRTNINVSITGETGTGKEVVAKAIHYNSDRSRKPFIPVNMAAIPRELIESELFGYEKGAFTGAHNRKTGKFEEAQGGTLFLDEIAELDLPLQSKLLRVIQERELVRLGGHEKIRLDFRLIVATHRNLSEEVKKGAFREDLYFRIIGLPIALPPLRDRGNDILILARFFTDQFATENRLPVLQLSEPAKQKLMQYRFPGNVRELKSVIELAAVLCDGKEILAEDITFTSARMEEEILMREKTLREHTCDIVRYYLKKYDQDIVLTAEKLDIGKSTIYKMIQQKEVVL